MDEREGSSRAILTNSGFEGYVFVELDEGMFLEDVVVAIGELGSNAEILRNENWRQHRFSSLDSHWFIRMSS